MKTRIGFISNSSSTSFIITAKDAVQVEEKLIQIFLYKYNNMAPLITSYFLDEMQKIDLSKSDINKGHFFTTNNEEWQMELSQSAKERIIKGLNLYVGTMPTSGDGGDKLSTFICENIKLNYEDDDFYIEKDTSY